MSWRTQLTLPRGPREMVNAQVRRPNGGGHGTFQFEVLLVPPYAADYALIEYVLASQAREPGSTAGVPNITIREASPALIGDLVRTCTGTLRENAFSDSWIARQPVFQALICLACYREVMLSSCAARLFMYALPRVLDIHYVFQALDNQTALAPPDADAPAALQTDRRRRRVRFR